MAAFRSDATRIHRGAWDVQHMPGGMVDLELLAEYLQLMNAETTPELLVRGLTETFQVARENGLINDAVADDLSVATDLWQTIDGHFRVAVSGAFDPASASPELREAIARVANVSHFDELSDNVSDMSERVARHLNSLTGLGPEYARVSTHV